jgi:surface antigen
MTKGFCKMAWRYLAIGAAAAALAGCAPTNQSAPPPVAAVSAPAAQPAPIPENVDPSMLGGVLAGSVGLGLENADRVAAYKAQVAALETGQRSSWRGDKGVYGYAEAGASQGSCRPFSQTVYIAGRPYVGHGSACRAQDGSWRMSPG